MCQIVVLQLSSEKQHLKLGNGEKSSIGNTNDVKAAKHSPFQLRPNLQAQCRRRLVESDETETSICGTTLLPSC